MLEHADPVGHGHGLDLVVGDVEDGGAELALDALELDPQVRAQLGVERGERLVHQVDARAGAPAPGRWRRAASRRRRARRPVVELAVDPQQRGDLAHPSALISASALAPERRAQREGQVVEHRDSAGRARYCWKTMATSRAAGGSARDVGARRSRSAPASGRSRPATSRSVVVLPAPVGPSRTTNSPSAMVKVEAVDRARVAEGLGHAVEADLSHAAHPLDAGAERQGPAARRRRTAMSCWRRRRGRRCSPIAARWLLAGRALQRAGVGVDRHDLAWCRDIRRRRPRRGPGRVVEADMLGADAEDQPAPVRRRAARARRPRRRRARPRSRRRRGRRSGRKFIGGEPMKSATNMRGAAGRRSRCGAPTCSTTPWFITAILSAIAMASSWSWVT